MTFIYSGIGSRKTTASIIQQMIEFGNVAAQLNFTLRSGGADGADTAFEQGCGNGPKEIFLPWKGFNKRESQFTSPTSDAINLASTIHPAWQRCSRGARLLISRNMHQILGYDLKTPTNFVVCWTPNGEEEDWQCSKDTGGTGSAIILASMHNIPVFNIYNNERYYEALDYMEKLWKNENF